MTDYQAINQADYQAINQANWDERVPEHLASREYGVARYAGDPDLLSDVVRFDRERLGDLTGLRGVHLQCHIGTDTVSLGRLGAQMIGVDFSAPAVAAARALATQIGSDAVFVESEIYAAPQALDGATFDLVYTGVGAICWLPDIDRWAGVVAALLEPGGRLFIRDGHPMMYALADARPDRLLVVEHPYFERPEPTIWNDGGTYVGTDHVFVNQTTHEWNHGIGEIVTALMKHGLELATFIEHDSAPWEAFPGQMVVDDAGEWRLADRPWRLPLTFTIEAIRMR